MSSAVGESQTTQPYTSICTSYRLASSMSSVDQPGMEQPPCSEFDTRFYRYKRPRLLGINQKETMSQSEFDELYDKYVVQTGDHEKCQQDIQRETTKFGIRETLDYVKENFRPIEYREFLSQLYYLLAVEGHLGSMLADMPPSEDIEGKEANDADTEAFEEGENQQENRTDVESSTSKEDAKALNKETSRKMDDEQKKVYGKEENDEKGTSHDYQKVSVRISEERIVQLIQDSRMPELFDLVSTHPRPDFKLTDDPKRLNRCLERVRFFREAILLHRIKLASSRLDGFKAAVLLLGTADLINDEDKEQLTN